MQEIEYEDGTKTKELFDSIENALEDGKRKAREKSIKRIKVTAIIPRKRK